MICGKTADLCGIHRKDQGSVCPASICVQCVTIYSFRSRAQSDGNPPSCPFCRTHYHERHLMEMET
jgi:hypothetical protein